MHTPRTLLNVAAAASLLSFSQLAYAGFLTTAGGTYDYLTTSNWSGGTIDNAWNSSLTGSQVLTFGTDATLSSSLSITNTSAFSHTFVGSGGDRTLTLGGSISLASNSTNANTNTVTIGSTTSGQLLNVNLGATTRTLFAGTNRTLDLVNVVSGTGGITKTGAGTLVLSGSANTFTGGFSIGSSGQLSGTVVVTKLANTGVASSIGAGTGSITFGGTSTGTLRYTGSGDSTNRAFTIGGQGAIFDASGTGSIKFTNNNAQTNGSTGTARTFTLTGSNTADNTMTAAFADAGTGGTVSLLKQGAGRWILAGNNTYTGTTTVENGTLELGAANRIGNSSNLVLSGGTFATGGFSETLGTLTLSADSTIDLGSGASALVFADSAASAWGSSFSLSIINFTNGVDSVRIGSSAAGLTSDQLAQITINGFAATIDGSGFLAIAAVPEPSTYALLAGFGGLALAAFRRRSR